MDAEVARLYARTAAKVAVLLKMPVGPTLVSKLYEVAREPMNSATSVDVTSLWCKVASWVAAQKMISTSDAVTGLRGMLSLPDKYEAVMLTGQEIASATQTSYATSMNDVALVERVSACLPACWVALDRTDISLAHLKAIERETRSCSPRVAQLVDEQVVPLAVEGGWTPGQTAKAARKLVIANDPEGAQRRAAAAKTEHSDVRIYHEPDGISTVAGTGEAPLVQAVFDRVNHEAAAMANAGDNRPVGIRRIHAMFNLVVNPGSGKSAGRKVETQVRMDLTTILCYDDKPCELVGYGPITAQMARELAADSTLRRLVTDPLTGDAIDLGLNAYRPSAALRRAMEAKRPTCSMPGCNRPAYSCEADHREERRDGGRTDLGNIGPLCKMHHQMKTKKRWKVDVHPDGTETWTSFFGFTYTKKPSCFPLPDPPPIDEEPPVDLADRLPDAFDPDPPREGDPLPEPPALTDEEYDEAGRALDTLDLLDISYRQWVDKHFDEMRAVGLVA